MDSLVVSGSLKITHSWDLNWTVNKTAAMAREPLHKKQHRTGAHYRRIICDMSSSLAVSIGPGSDMFLSGQPVPLTIEQVSPPVLFYYIFDTLLDRLISSRKFR